MQYKMKIISERVCCCMDAATGSMLTGIYTCFLSLVFVAIGVDSLVDASKEPHSHEDLAALSAVLGLMVALSLLFGIASVSLVLGAARKFKTYLIMWIILAPLWTTLAFCQLIILPIYVIGSGLTDFTSRVCGTVFIMATNIFCMFCVYLLFATLSKSPVNSLHNLGVVEALESGFSSGYSRLRESIRPSKSKGTAMYNGRPSADPVTLPEVSVSVVLDPNNLESSHSKSRRPPNASGEKNKRAVVGAEVTDSWNKSLPSADQLQANQPQHDGFDNVGFVSDI